MQNACSHLDMESQAKDKTFHAVSEAALISLQCGFHLFKRGDVLQFLKKIFWQPDNINLTLPKKNKTTCLSSSVVIVQLL